MAETLLPSRINWVTDSYEPVDFEKTKALYEAIGIKVLRLATDDLFVVVELPDGWRYQDTSGYWSYVYDENGQERVSCFIKIAIYERDAFSNIKKK
jgi:hypothetical protein